MTTEYVPLHLILSAQEMVYRERVDYYKAAAEHGIESEPIELKEKGDFYVLGNGHHRAVAALERGEPGIEATTNYQGSVLGTFRPLHKIKVLSGDRPGNHLPDLAAVIRATKSHCL